MAGINKVTLVGNLGQDPELKALVGSNRPCCNFSIATSETWKDKQTGEKREQTEWHNLAAFDRMAELAHQYLKKGSKVYIEGQLKTRSWEKDGVKQYRTDILVRKLEFLDSKGASDAGEYQAPARQNDNLTAKSVTAPPIDDGNDDIPF